MAVRGAALHQRGIPIIPAHHQPQVSHRRIRSRACTNHNRNQPQPCLHIGVIPAVRPLPRAQPRKQTRRGALTQRRLKTVKAFLIGHHRNSATATRRARHQCNRQQISPIILRMRRQHTQHRACWLPIRQIGHKLRAVLVVVKSRRITQPGRIRSKRGEPAQQKRTHHLNLGSIGATRRRLGRVGCFFSTICIIICIRGVLPRMVTIAQTGQLREPRQVPLITFIQCGNTRRHRQPKHIRHR